MIGNKFSDILGAIEKADTVIIHRHSNPDGDAVGSQTGLKLLIKHNLPEKRVYAVGDGPGRYDFIEGSEPDVIDDETYAGALAVVLDTSAEFLISDKRYKKAAFTARIDHHVNEEKICDTEVVDQNYESCCGLVADLAKEAGWELTLPAASALFAGLVTDSGRFRYDSVSARTFQTAAYLMSQPVDTNRIYGELYANDFGYILRKARFTEKIRFTKSNVAYIYTTADEVSSDDIDAHAISRGMVGTMADIAGVPIWVNFTETGKSVLCEIRSDRYDIRGIAAKYGGGGHEKASGAEIADAETATAMLADLDALAGKEDESLTARGTSDTEKY